MSASRVVVLPFEAWRPRWANEAPKITKFAFYFAFGMLFYERTRREMYSAETMRTIRETFNSEEWKNRWTMWDGLGRKVHGILSPKEGENLQEINWEERRQEANEVVRAYLDSPERWNEYRYWCEVVAPTTFPIPGLSLFFTVDAKAQKWLRMHGWWYTS
ncbi:MAG: hypothetical protein MHM6MM_003628 [Cercozoa sp. M6MM]